MKISTLIRLYTPEPCLLLYTEGLFEPWVNGVALLGVIVCFALDKTLPDNKKSTVIEQ